MSAKNKQNNIFFIVYWATVGNQGTVSERMGSVCINTFNLYLKSKVISEKKSLVLNGNLLSNLECNSLFSELLSDESLSKASQS